MNEPNSYPNPARTVSCSTIAMVLFLVAAGSIAVYLTLNTTSRRMERASKQFDQFVRTNPPLPAASARFSQMRLNWTQAHHPSGREELRGYLSTPAPVQIYRGLLTLIGLGPGHLPTNTVGEVVYVNGTLDSTWNAVTGERLTSQTLSGSAP